MTDEEWAGANRIVDRAIADYRRVLPPAQLEAYRAELIAHLVSDPEGRTLLRRTLSDPVVQASDAVPKAVAPPSAATAAAKKKVSG